ENVVVTPGAKPAVFCTALSLIAPGDEVLCPDPGFPIYESVVRFAGGRPVYYPLDETREFAPHVEAIAERITARTRVLILNVPHNPTGGVATTRDLAVLADLAPRHGLWVLSDQVYGKVRHGSRRDQLRVGRGRLLLLPRHQRSAGADGGGPHVQILRRAAARRAAHGRACGHGVRAGRGGAPAVVLRHGAGGARAGARGDPAPRGE